MARKPDPDVAAFEASLLRSVDQMLRGEVAQAHTLDEIKARRGRPVGTVKRESKRPTTLRLDPESLARWRASGKGWQTRAAQVLAEHAPKPG